MKKVLVFSLMLILAISAFADKADDVLFSKTRAGKVVQSTYRVSSLTNVAATNRLILVKNNSSYNQYCLVDIAMTTADTVPSASVILVEVTVTNNGTALYTVNLQTEDSSDLGVVAYHTPVGTVTSVATNGSYLVGGDFKMRPIPYPIILKPSTTYLLRLDNTSATYSANIGVILTFWKK